MRITHVDACLVKVPFNGDGLYMMGSPVPETHMDVVLVRMRTDEGIEGIGFQEDQSTVSVALINSIVRDYLVDNRVSPYDIEVISELLRGVQSFSGQCSAVEVAAWDIMGKAAGLPISKMLGGFRDKVTAYASTVVLKSAEERMEDVEYFLGRGFRAMKIKVHRLNPDKELKEVQKLQTMINGRMRLMVDAHHARKTAISKQPPWTREQALKFARGLDECGVAWLEEPMPRNDLEGLAMLCAAVDMPIAGGEAEYGIFQYRQYLEQKAFDIIQCDVTLSGGFLETRKIAALAQAFSRPCIPHAWSVGAGIIANLHMCCSLPNCDLFEYIIEPPAMDEAMRDMVLVEPLKFEDGYVYLPDKPGLGAELNWDVIKRYTV